MWPVGFWSHRAPDTRTIVGLDLTAIHTFYFLVNIVGYMYLITDRDIALIIYQWDWLSEAAHAYYPLSNEIRICYLNNLELGYR